MLSKYFYSDGKKYDFSSDLNEVEVVVLQRGNKYIGHIFYNFITSTFIGIRKSFDETSMLQSTTSKRTCWGQFQTGLHFTATAPLGLLGHLSAK